MTAAPHTIVRLLGTLVCVLLAALSAYVEAGAAPSSSPAESASSTAAEAKITQLASAHRYPLEFDGKTFSGSAWQRLIEEGRHARFLLLGEEHGIAENAHLAAQLFTTLAPAGYRRMLIEISPPMATIIDDASRGGVDGLKALFGQAGGEPAFFGMTEEAAMLASVREAVPSNEPAFWGADYEVGGDRALLRVLDATPKPQPADAALDRLIEASNAAWRAHAETGEAQHIFTFSGDPQLVRAVEHAWPTRDPASAWLLDTLEETLEINRLWAQRQGFASNQRRARLLRSNFLRHWHNALNAGEPPRVMAKFGANHMIRGRNMTDTYDLGALLPEVAEARGERAFALLVLPGQGSATAVLDPSRWAYVAAPPKDGYRRGLDAVLAAVWPDRFTLIDLRALRSDTSRYADRLPSELVRVVFGFDMVLVMSGSTAASDLEHD